MHHRAFKKNRSASGFTLIELLVVISIIALLIAILLPALGSARSAARTVICLTKIRTIGLAAELYRNDFKSWYPPDSVNPAVSNATYKPWTGPGVYRFDELVTPYLSSPVETFTQGAAKNPWLCTENPYQPGWSTTQVRTTGYSAGSGMRGNFFTTTHYGWNGASYYQDPVNDIKEPTSKVVLTLEVKGLYFNRVQSGLTLGAYLHQGGVNLFAMTDGHAKSSKAITITELEADNMQLNTK